MALRDLAGGAARMSAGFWKEVANALDAPPQEPAEQAVPETKLPEAPAAPSTAPPVVIPEGGMLVPIDTWTRVLDQLGNLHQAGQDLAEARERAAKAETESVFLREQLSEERSKRARPKEAPQQSVAADRPGDRPLGVRAVRSARSGLATARDRWRDSRQA